MTDAIDYVITAKFEPEMDERRNKRIEDAIDRSGANWLHCVEWNAYCCEDGSHATNTEIAIYLDDHDKASRLQSELRACGMVVGLGR